MRWEFVDVKPKRPCKTPGCPNHAAHHRKDCWACNSRAKRASRRLRGLSPTQSANTRWVSVGLEIGQYAEAKAWAQANNLSLNAAICSAIEYSMEQ